MEKAYKEPLNQPVSGNKMVQRVRLSSNSMRLIPGCIFEDVSDSG